MEGSDILYGDYQEVLKKVMPFVHLSPGLISFKYKVESHQEDESDYQEVLKKVMPFVHLSPGRISFKYKVESYQEDESDYQEDLNKVMQFKLESYREYEKYKVESYQEDEKYKVESHQEDESDFLEDLMEAAMQYKVESYQEDESDLKKEFEDLMEAMQYKLESYREYESDYQEVLKKVMQYKLESYREYESDLKKELEDLMEAMRDLKKELEDLMEAMLDDVLKVPKERTIPAYFQSKPNNQRLISGVYGVDPRDNKRRSRVLKIEHCASQEFGNQWQLEVKCRPKGSKDSSGRWTNIRSMYPDATVKVKQNYIELTLPTVEDSHEFAVFGTSEVKDKKRMRLGIFGGKATRGQDWNIVGTLFDDTMLAFESLCEKEERKGRQLLTILPGLFISNSGEDIKIDISGLEEGWKIVGNSLMTIKSKDAWNSPENSTDFPCCVFEITHVDETKQLFSCEITASHLNDSAETELVAFFEQANEVMTPPELPIQKKNVFDLFVFLQMLVFLVECFTGSSFDPQAPKKGSVVDQVESFNSN